MRGTPREKEGLPTSELLDWLKLLMVEDIGPDTLRDDMPVSS